MNTILTTILVLFATHFIILPFGVSPFEIPKVFFVEIIIFLSIVFQFDTIQHSIAQLPRSITYAYSLLLGLLIVQLVLYHRTEILFGSIFRLQGGILLGFLLIFSISSARFSQITAKLPYTGIITFVVLFTSSLLIAPDLGGRTIGTLGEPNALGAAFIFLWPLAFSLNPAEKTIKYAYHTLFLLLVAVAVFFTGSRSATLALLLQLIFMHAIRYFPLKYAVLAVCMLVFLSFLYPLYTDTAVFENRAEVWQTALHAGLQSPVIGNGFGLTQQSLAKSAQSLGNTIRFQTVDSSHNIFLDWWVQGGIVGLGVLVYLVYFTLSRFISTKNIVLLTSFIGLITALSFNPASVVGLISLWWVFGETFRKA